MRRITILALFLTVSLWAWSQNTPDMQADQQQAQQGNWQRYGRRGPGVAGTITAITDNSITIKTMDGQTAQVNVNSETQFRKNREQAKLTDFKIGDEVFVRGEQKDGAWQAQVVAARPAGGMGGMGGGAGMGAGGGMSAGAGAGAGGGRPDFRADMGKKFIAGEVKAINGTQLTIQRPDGVSQNITVDENTSFRKDNESITLGDLKVGDHVFGRGELKNDVFVPAQLNVGQPRFGMNRGGQGGPGGPPPQQQSRPQQ